MTTQRSSRVSSAAANGRNGHSLIDDEKFRQLYELTLALRSLAERADGDSRLRGHEAALAGVAADLRAGDLMLTEPGTQIADSLRRVCPALVSASPASTLEKNLIDGVARAVHARIRNSGAVAVVFTPPVDSEPLLRETFTVADRARLPILFVERPDSASGSTRKSGKQQAAESGSMPAIPVDAQDVVAIYRVAHESIQRARSGTGPTRILCMSWQPSTRRRISLNTARADAVEHLEQWLAGRGLPADRWRREIVARIEKAACTSQAAPAGVNHAATEAWSETEHRQTHNLA